MHRRFVSILSRLLPAVLAVVLAVSVLPLGSAHAFGARRYARPLGLISGACDSWAHACELYYALQVSSANNGGEVWARAGLYTPDASVRANSLVVGEGTLLYGGFKGDETALSQRNPSVNITTLTGDIGTLGTSTDNSYHVVVLNSVSSATLVDGFTLTQGYASGPGTYDVFGGGMLIFGGAPRVQRVNFVDNFATDGGGLAVLNNASPTLTNLSFFGNQAITGGGGMYVTQSTPSLSKSSFSANMANIGGGLQLTTGGNAVLNNVTFVGNFAAGPTGSGGGIYNDHSTPSLTNVAFTGNQATNGGGMLNYKTGATLSKVRFIGNSADNNGGGMFSYANISPITLTDVSFIGNEARTAYGGGMYTSSCILGVTLKNVTVANNLAAIQAGGLYNLNSHLALTNVTVAGNAGSAGGFLNDGSTLTIKFATVSNNTGGAMSNVNTTTVTISNSIFWNDAGGEISNTMAATVSFSHGILQGGCASATFAICTAANKNPKLKVLKNYGGFTPTMALAYNSPAIDKVSCSGVKADQRGVKRPQGLKCDIGAFEYKP